MKTASHAQSSRPGTALSGSGLTGTCRATCHQPSAVAISGDGQRDGERRAEVGLHHRGRCDRKRRGRHQGAEGEQGEGEAERPPRRILAGRLQQGETARRGGAQSRQRARCRRRAGAERRAQHNGTRQRTRHDQQADLLERRCEAQAEGLADRLEGHVGGDAVDHDRGHDGEEGGKVNALDEEHDREDGDRHEEGGENHGGRH